MLRYIEDYYGSRIDQSKGLNSDMIEGFNKLKEFSKNLPSTNFEDLKLLLDKGLYSVFVGRTIRKGMSICRGRSHIGGPAFFLSEKDISYISSPEVLGRMNYFGRANMPFQSIFYGSLPSGEIPVIYSTPVFECSSVLREKCTGESSREEIITCGVWKVVKDFDVVELVFSTDAIKNSRYVQERFEFYKNELNNMPDNNMRDHSLEVLTFLSDEFAKKEISSPEEYKISSAYSNLIWTKLAIAGILFPSVQSEYRSLNIALQPEAVDKYLKFDSAVMVRIKKEDKNVFMEDHYLLKSNARNQKYFVWEKYNVSHF